MSRAAGITLAAGFPGQKQAVPGAQPQATAPVPGSGLLIHVPSLGWRSAMLRTGKQDEVLAGIAHVEKLGQQIYERSGLAFSTLVYSAVTTGGLVRLLNATGARLFVLAQWPQTWMGHRFVFNLARRVKQPVLLLRRPPQGVYQRVVVVVDGSSDDIACIREARAIAPSAELILVCALDRDFESRLYCADVSDEVIRRIRDKRRGEAMQQLEVMCRRAGVPPYQVAKVVDHAYAPRLVLDTVNEFLADLLVLRHRSSSFLHRLFFRSTAAEVLERATSDVLLVAGDGTDVS